MRRAVLLVAVASCIDSGSAVPNVDRKLVQANLVREVPSGLTRVDASLGPGVVTYVGYQASRPDSTAIADQGSAGPVVPGQSIRITHYWRVEHSPGPGWSAFAYLRGAAGSADFMYIDPSDMQLAHPVSAWRSGEIIRDTHDIVVRPDWQSNTATLYVGLVRTGGHGVADRMIAFDPASRLRRSTASDRAVIAAVFDVDLSKAPPPAGTIYVPRRSAPIAIDGQGMDPGWATAAASAEFQTADGSPDPVGRTTAKLTWDDDQLYVLIQVADTDIYSPYKQHDDPLWKADAVEVFIDADGNRRGYVELQVNPNNATFDSWFAATRSQPGDPSWDSAMVTAVSVRGTPDQAGDSDSGWSAEIAIPWAAVKGRDAAMSIHTPPHIGDRWRVNVVRVDAKSGKDGVAASSWNPISNGDFHALDRMLTIVFADAAGSIEIGAAGATPPGASPQAP